MLAIAIGSLTYSIGYAAILEYSLDNWMVLFEVLNVISLQSLPLPTYLPAVRSTFHCVDHRVVQYGLAFDCQRQLVKKTHMYRVCLDTIMHVYTSWVLAEELH